MTQCCQVILTKLDTSISLGCLRHFSVEIITSTIQFSRNCRMSVWTHRYPLCIMIRNSNTSVWTQSYPHCIIMLGNSNTSVWTQRYPQWIMLGNSNTSVWTHRYPLRICQVILKHQYGPTGTLCVLCQVILKHQYEPTGTLS